MREKSFSVKFEAMIGKKSHEINEKQLLHIPSKVLDLSLCEWSIYEYGFTGFREYDLSSILDLKLPEKRCSIKSDQETIQFLL